MVIIRFPANSRVKVDGIRYITVCNYCVIGETRLECINEIRHQMAKKELFVNNWYDVVLDADDIEEVQK